MRQRRWMELLKDYDCEIHYHPGKANVVADALSRKGRAKAIPVQMARIDVVSVLLYKLLTVQKEAVLRGDYKGERMAGLMASLHEDSEGLLRFQDRVWVPRHGGVRDMLLEDAHKSRYSIHPGSAKMYGDLKRYYWWPGMKRDIGKYVEQCVTCLQVKAEHQKPYGSLQPLEIPSWKWEHITMDFITKLPRTMR